MGTAIPFPSKWFMTESLKRQKKKKLTVLQSANLIYDYKEGLNMICILKGHPTYTEGLTLTQAVMLFLTRV
jgi:hypothetical protein